MPHRARTRSAEVASGSQRVYHSSGSPAAARNSGSSLNRRRGSGSSSRSQQSSGQSSRRSPSRARFPGSSLVTPATELVSDDASPRGGSSSVGNSRIRCVRSWVLNALASFPHMHPRAKIVYIYIYIYITNKYIFSSSLALAGRGVI